MVELTGSEREVAAELTRLTGLSRHVHLQLGGEWVAAQFDEGRDDGRRISAAQYVRFPVHGAPPEPAGWSAGGGAMTR
jgi:hypothetical protein